MLFRSHRQSHQKFKFRNYHGFNATRWCDLFRDSGVEARILQCNNPNEVNKLLVDEINRLDNAVIPLVEIRFDRKTPWNTRSLRTQKKSVEWLYQRSKKSGNPTHKASYRTAQRQFEKHRTANYHKNIEKKIA